MSVQPILIAVLTPVSTPLAPTHASADQAMCSTLMDTTAMVSCNNHLTIPCKDYALLYMSVPPLILS